jgi:DNA-binding XRE family transcriptional regulator
MNDAVARFIARQLVHESLDQCGFVPSELALTSVRVQAGLSIQQLAELAGLSYTAVRAAEHDLYPPTRKHVDAVMSAVGRVGLMTTVVGVGLDREVWIRFTNPTPTTDPQPPTE